LTQQSLIWSKNYVINFTCSIEVYCEIVKGICNIACNMLILSYMYVCTHVWILFVISILFSVVWYLVFPCTSNNTDNNVAQRLHDQLNDYQLPKLISSCSYSATKMYPRGCHLYIPAGCTSHSPLRNLSIVQVGKPSMSVGTRWRNNHTDDWSLTHTHTHTSGRFETTATELVHLS
jgi:D-alanyl-lipoteichoic acid acyltransferase DltB (MBOAT superfamily)